MSCYYVKPYTETSRWATVLGPGDRVEVDFLPDHWIANEIAFQRNLGLSAAWTQLRVSGRSLIVTPAEARAQRMKRR